MTDPIPSSNLLQRLQAGDQEAAQEVFARYAQRLSLLAEQHLSRKLAGRVDGEDVVQSVFRTFFRRCSEGEFRVGDSAQLWKLLVKITVTKACAMGRFHTSAKRDATAEVGTGEEWLLEAATRDPSPAEAAVLADEIEAMLRGLPALYGSVLEMRLADYSVEEIARKLGVSRRTIYRALELLQQRLNKSLTDRG